MKVTKLTLIIFLFLLFPSLPMSVWAYTETFYLRAKGNGSAPETISGAFNAADFNNSANWDTDDANDGLIGPNDRVIVLDDDGNITSQLRPQVSGLSGKPITIMGESGGRATINGTGLGKTNLLQIERSYIIVDGLIIKNSGNSGIGNWDGMSSNVIIRNCTIDNNANQGIYAGKSASINARNWTIEKNIITNNGTDYILDHGIYFNYGDHNIIQYNYFSGNAAFSIQLQNSCDNNIVRYNYSENNGDYAGGLKSGGFITIWDNGGGGSTNNEVYYNISYRDFRGAYIGGSQDCTGNKIYNNTFYEYTHYGLGVGNGCNAGEFKNNILWSAVSSKALWIDSGSNVITDYNILGPESHNYIYWNGSVYSTLAAYKSGQPTKDQNSSSFNPSLSNPSGGDFQLSSGSPCIDAGYALSADYYYAIAPGVTKTDWPHSVLTMQQSNPWDMGAFVYSGIPDADPPEPPSGVVIVK